MLKKILAFYMKFFVLWVILFGILAYFFPKPFEALKNYNHLFFAVTMFGIGAVLKTEDFKRIAQRPTIVFIGSAAQFIIMPFGAFAFSKMFGLPPELAVGLIIAGSAPGAMASNVMCYIGKADTAYSVSLTTVSTFLSPLLTPALTKFFAGKEMDVKFLPMFWDVTWMVLIPLLIGFFGRNVFKTGLIKKAKYHIIILSVLLFLFGLALSNHLQYRSFHFPRSMTLPFYAQCHLLILAAAVMSITIIITPKKAVDELVDLFPAVSATFIVFICSLVIALNKNRIFDPTLGWMLLAVLAVVVILNVYGMCAGYGVGRFFKMTIPRRRTLCIEIGMQNAGLGTVLALEHFGPKTAIPTAMFVFVCIITASILVEIWQRKDSVYLKKVDI